MKQMISWVLPTLCFATVPAVLRAAEPAPSPAAIEFFEKKIRPVFAEHCQKCHGGDKVKGGLRLTTRALLLKGGDTGPAVLPGDPEKSLLIRSVGYHDEQLKMPPKGKLSDTQIADLTRWVKDGAAWPESDKTTVAADPKGPLFSKEQREFWAFQPLRQTMPPAVKNNGWPLSPIDRFLLSRLEEKGLQPAPPADRRTLIRRATFDLTGLPPTPEEVEQFLADKSPDAFARLIDRLLASPTYGERWGRHWLDVARYADSNGLDENTAFGNAWRYRDYVVQAFNKDKPYDQFLVEQLSGDLLPSSGNEAVDQEHLTATGFLVLGPKVLAEPDKQKMVMDIVDEQLDVTCRAFLGLTAGCARCHDHKFDPIPTRDYYSLAGIFKSTRTMATLSTVARANERPLASKEEESKVLKTQNQLKALQGEIKQLTDKATADIRKTYHKDLARYLLAASNRVEANKPVPGTKTEQLAPDVIKAWSTYLAARKKRGNDPIFGPWFKLADLPTEGFAADADKLVKQIQTEVSAKQSKLLAPVQALFAGASPKSLAEVADRYGKLFAEIDQIADHKQPDAERETLRQVLVSSKGPFGQVAVNPDHFPEPVKQELQRLKAEVAKLPTAAAPMVLAVQDEARIENVRVHIRGNHLTLGAETPRQFFQIIAGENQTALDSKHSGRLELARWMTRSDNPLTARVMVNRIWQHHFGEGIVRSPDNFGKLGDRPSHPELLDFLALRFMEKGWSIKEMHRLIMLSQAYQMSSSQDDKAAQVDPDNRLLSHVPRRRMEVEAIRDSMLAISGKLDRTLGGSLMTTKNFDYVTNDQSGNAANYTAPRRSIYLPVIRNAVFDVFQVFDFVEPSVLNGKRDSTTVAPQALFLMNGPFVIEQSRALAEKLLKEPGQDDAARVRALYALTLTRPPTDREIEQTLGYVKVYSDRLAATMKEPDKRRVRAWQSLCQVLFASNEFVYIH